MLIIERRERHEKMNEQDIKERQEQIETSISQIKGKGILNFNLLPIDISMNLEQEIVKGLKEEYEYISCCVKSVKQ